VKLSAKAERRLVRNVKRRPLAQMHLLLRRYGWKPEHYDAGIHIWYWRRRGLKETRFTTRNWNRKPRWSEEQPVHTRYGTHWRSPGGQYGEQFFYDVDSLRARLKELAQKK
jgi:hypothetical protein